MGTVVVHVLTDKKLGLIEAIGLRLQTSEFYVATIQTNNSFSLQGMCSGYIIISYYLLQLKLRVFHLLLVHFLYPG